MAGTNGVLKRAQTGKVEITPSVIFAKYLCQVPQRKSGGSLFLSILLADLVLLQALWKVVNFTVSTYVVRKNPTRNYCLGDHGHASLDDPGMEMEERKGFAHSSRDRSDDHDDAAIERFMR
ncbi:MAG: hypothetical protein Q9187_006197 [Circinaria calcarea]